VGPAAVGSATFPAFDAMTRQLTVDLGALAGDDDIYRRNPKLLEQFTIREDSAGLYELEVVSADADPSDPDRALLTLGGSAALTGSFALIPNFFRVVTEGTQDALPASSEIQIQFQATRMTPVGAPDLGAIFPAADTWATDIADLNTLPDNLGFQFIRFRVTFDVRADGGQLTFDTPIPSLEYLRVPMRF
jgi:hypothetical protein